MIYGWRVLREETQGYAAVHRFRDASHETSESHTDHSEISVSETKWIFFAKRKKKMNIQGTVQNSMGSRRSLSPLSRNPPKSYIAQRKCGRAHVCSADTTTTLRKEREMHVKWAIKMSSVSGSVFSVAHRHRRGSHPFRSPLRDARRRRATQANSATSAVAAAKRINRPICSH